MAGTVIPNSPSNITLNDFRAAVNRFDEVAWTSFYSIQIIPIGRLIEFARPLLQDLTFLTSEAELPGRGIQTANYRYYGPVINLPVLSEFRETTVQFYCRTQSFERQFFDDWMDLINPPSTNDFTYLDDYKASIRMFQLSDLAKEGTNDPQATYSWTLHDVYPMLVNIQPVSWAGPQVQKLSVTFAYSRWTREARSPKPYSHPMVRGAQVTRSGGKSIVLV
jgi:hypothetical protein